MNITKEDVQTMVDMVWDEVGHAFDERPVVKVSRRTTRRVIGSTVYQRSGWDDEAFALVYTPHINLYAGSMLWYTLDAVEDVIRHEFAHVLAFQYHGPAACRERQAGHGDWWLACAKKLGAYPSPFRPTDNDLATYLLERRLNG